MTNAPKLDEVSARLAVISLLSHPDFPQAARSLRQAENRVGGSDGLRKLFADRGMPTSPVLSFAFHEEQLQGDGTTSGGGDGGSAFCLITPWFVHCITYS